MEVEQLAIRDYLAQCVPLKALSAAKLDELTHALEIRHFVNGNDVLKCGERNDHALLIRHGAIEVTREDGSLYGRFSEGEWVGYRSVMRGGTVSLNVRAIEDTVFYALPAAVFLALLVVDERVRSYFSELKPERMRSAIQEMHNHDDYSLLAIRLADLARPSLAVERTVSIRDTAQQMNDSSSDTALVMEAGGLCGIVTDKDFRTRVVAQERDMREPIDAIMTPRPLTLEPTATASEALLLMARRNIRQIPVVGNLGKTIHGIVSASDLLRSQSHNPVFLIGDIHEARDVAGLQKLSQHLPKALVGMVRSSLPAYDIGHAISSIGQAIVRRLLKLAEEQFGAPPIAYTYIVAGSMARREQTAHSDQDTAMILSDEYDEQLHGEYFLNVAKYVSDGMDACGYIYCPGDVMATNPKWRQPLSVWRGYFTNWIERPDPQALLYASIFFDLRSLYGEEHLLAKLHTEILEKTRKNTLFQAYMAANALSHQPPLGIFKGFVLEKNGDNGKALDMKKRGVMPVIDLARVYALATGVSALNTCERLAAIAEVDGGISAERVADLKDAFEFISTTRLQHQALQVEAGNSPDNYVSPEQLSALERRHLKDAFEVVSDMQKSMAHSYQADRFR